MVAAAEQRWPLSFWQVQLAGWTVFYVLLLLAALRGLSDRDVFRYNTIACVILFCISLLLRPVCRAAVKFWHSSRPALVAAIFAVCLPLGWLASLATGLGTFGWQRLNESNVGFSWLQSAVALFLWCHIYISMKQPDGPNSDGSPDALHHPDLFAAPVKASAGSTALNRPPESARRFLVRTGSRIQVVLQDTVLWFSAAGDYVELHTATGTHLVRETMCTLHDSLDPAVFVRIHRSRIVRWAEITELIAAENGEYRVRLKDGSEHRSSRTYAPLLSQWLSSASNTSDG